jgi:disulfide bond formation protein DsbB
MQWIIWLRSRRRGCNAAAAVACFALLGFAYFLQYGQLLDPCPLCIFQRVAVTALGIAFCLAALVPAAGILAGRGVAILLGLVALTGAGVAWRHLYIQALPPGQVPVCGATLEYMLDVFPVAEVLRKVLTGSGECAKVDWSFLGIAMPGWVLIWMLALGTLGVLVNWRAGSAPSR